MEYRTLGRTGLQVSVLGMGGVFISAGSATRREGILAIRRAAELGVTYFDTAPTYSDSEEVLGTALEDVPGPVIVSTKLGGRPEPFDPRDPVHLRRSVEESLRNLRREYLDLLLIHEPDRPGQYDWFTDPDHYTGPVCEVLADLQREGLVRHTGVGGTTAYELAHIVATGQFDVVLTAFNYSLLWREAGIEILPAAAAQGMGVIIGSALQQGALARRYDEEVANGARWLSSPRRAQFRALYALLNDLQMPVAEAALRWVLSNPAVSTVLMGARSVSEVELNAAAVEEGPLPEDVLRRLDEIAAMVPFRPFEEPLVLPFGRSQRMGPGRAR